ncbi:hypothetical protein DUI87_34799 [Hirundo rustica rustica]|uniref:CCHC-type domain-containing protein n=1 Tax=Hirundo rustica rustica TaxID=333673 RepID=A0A3M0IJD6_HIRRU|nr:hypothetical protein DUI87_34799 [Hirundo rustica rustica]
MACCPSTMPGCLAGTAGVGPHWHSFIQCLQELSGALSRAHGTEHVLLNFHPLVRDALRQAQINGAEASEQEESDYASIWVETPGVFLLSLKEKSDSREDKKRGKREEEVPLVPPPYVPPQAPPLPDNENAEEQAEAPPRGPMTRQRVRQQNLYPLREMPMGGPQAEIGFISVPLSSGDVRDFKKEMGNLLEDPLGVSERVDQFLGPNIYAWDELQSILGILFTSEEKNMIRRAGMRIWDAQQFVDHLRSQVERQVQDPEVQAELIKEMAQRNGNGTCRRIILSLPLDPSPSLAQMIEACTKRAELFSASERNPGLTHPKPVAAAAPGARRQLMSSDQLQHIICHRCKRPGHFTKACPENQKHLLIGQ